MSRHDKKQRREQKRKVRRVELRRKQSGSPIKRLVEAPGDVECWMSKDFEEMGQRQIFAFKRAGGLSGIFCFLIDRGVVGLTDAWARIGFTREDLLHCIDRAQGGGIQMRSVRPEEGRKWVVSAARWAHDNGMRLPKEWMKMAAVLGDVSDWESADVSAFLKEFAGHPEDLRQRLIGESLENYLKRGDTKIFFNTEAPYMDQQTGEYLQTDPIEAFGEDDVDAMNEELERRMPVDELNELAELLEPAAQDLAQQTAEWLKAHQDLPSGELFEAWKSMMLSRLMLKHLDPEASYAALEDSSEKLAEMMAGRLGSASVDEHNRALQQARRYLQSDKSLLDRTVIKHGLANVLND